MGGIQVTLKARTKKELEQKAREWLRDRREQGWDIRAGWDPTEAKRMTGSGKLHFRATLRRGAARLSAG